MDHGLGDVDTLLVVAHEATLTRHPTNSVDHPSARQQLKVRIAVDPADIFDYAVLECRLFHKIAPIIGAVGEEMLDPEPTFAIGAGDHLHGRTDLCQLMH